MKGDYKVKYLNEIAAQQLRQSRRSDKSFCVLAALHETN